jgi:hypothetical protein
VCEENARQDTTIVEDHRNAEQLQWDAQLMEDPCMRLKAAAYSGDTPRTHAKFVSTKQAMKSGLQDPDMMFSVLEQCFKKLSFMEKTHEGPDRLQLEKEVVALRLELNQSLTLLRVFGSSLFDVSAMQRGKHRCGITRDLLLVWAMNGDARSCLMDMLPEIRGVLCELSLGTDGLETIFGELVRRAGYKPTYERALAYMQTVLVLRLCCRCFLRLFSDRELDPGQTRRYFNYSPALLSEEAVLIEYIQPEDARGMAQV